MNKYEKISFVGRGAYGLVHLCCRLEDQKKVIIKQIPVEEMSSEEKQASLNEAKVLSMLDHPNIIAYYDNFLEEKSIVIVMEYAPGGTLYQYLKKRNNTSLLEEEVLHFFAQMVMALHHVHSRQILHRDLKSQNIFMNEGQELIKLGDFGISKVLTTKSKAFTVVGTPCYLSPELCEGKPYNQKSDIWALGCVLYELLMLKKPFEGENLPALVVKIMRGSFEPVSNHYANNLRQLLVSMLAADPSRRPLIPQIMACPCLVRVMYPLYLYIGLVPQTSKESSPSCSTNENSNKQIYPSALKFPRVRHSCYRILQYNEISKKPLEAVLPSSSSSITSVAAANSKVFLLTKSGSTFEWQKGTLDGLTFNLSHEKLSLHIVQIACGKTFTVFLTSRGLVLTCGSGECLGHGNTNNISKPKIVEVLLGLDVTNIACGQEHVVVVTKEGFLFAWGNGKNGRLGLGGTETRMLPQKVPLPDDIIPCLVACSNDSSFIVTKICQLLATGNNRHNKLGMDDEDGYSIDELKSFTKVSAFRDQKIKSVSCGATHTAVLADDGHCFTFGSNKFGQLGWGNSVGWSHNLAGQIEMPEDEIDTLLQVSCGDKFTVALALSNKTFLWGMFGSSGILKAHCLSHQPTSSTKSGSFAIQMIIPDREYAMFLAKDDVD